MRSTLLDTGVIVALLDRDERHHEQCLDVVSDLVAPRSEWKNDSGKF